MRSRRAGRRRPPMAGSCSPRAGQKEGRCKIRDERFSGGGHCLWEMPEMADTRMRYVTERRSVGGRISTARRDGDGTGRTESMGFLEKHGSPGKVWVCSTGGGCLSMIDACRHSLLYLDSWERVEQGRCMRKFQASAKLRLPVPGLLLRFV